MNIITHRIPTFQVFEKRYLKGRYFIMIIENGVKHIRMGWENDFVNYVVLSDGTVLQNMQCDLSAKIPSDEELEMVNRQNMKVKKDDIFSKFEQKECELQEITDMLWLVYEDYYGIKENDLYVKANNYDRLERYLINIHSLLFTRHKEMEETMNEVYAERKLQKEGVN